MNDDDLLLRRISQSPCVIEVADSLSSTNTVLKSMAHRLPHAYTLVTREQTAGRGQRGNTWEAEPGMNLTFSMLLRPQCITPARQFVISEAVAMGIACALDPLLPAGMRAEIKWPNDIYAGDRKICGILIEHTLGSASGITWSVAGAGVNVNQREFLSPAPNPVSLAQLTGREFDLTALMKDVAGSILREFEAADSPDTEAAAGLHRRFMQRLWRNDGAAHPFRYPSGELFNATIVDVAPDGRLTLAGEDGSTLGFYFKEVAFEL